MKCVAAAPHGEVVNWIAQRKAVLLLSQTLPGAAVPLCCLSLHTQERTPGGHKIGVPVPGDTVEHEPPLDCEGSTSLPLMPGRCGVLTRVFGSLLFRSLPSPAASAGIPVHQPVNGQRSHCCIE